jgi:serine/threonine-protein kinase
MTDPNSDQLLQIVQEGVAAKYAVERQVGRGGTAIVYLANDLRHRRRVALKLLDPELAVAIGADRFQREIDIAAQLNHPHVLPLLDSGTIDLAAGAGPRARRSLAIEVPYYVMPFIVGESLRDRLVREGALALNEALRIARQVADALDYAHREGIVHRDIKPENILFSDGHAVVADFGIARALDRAGTDRVTRAGIVVGTPQYMSPEQITDEQSVDGRSDLYSLGCVLFEMITGRPPQDAATVQKMIARRLHEPAPSLRHTGITVPPFVDQALQRALAPEPGARFSTGAELAAALTPGGVEVHPPKPAGALRGVWLVVPLVIFLLAVVFALRGRTSAGSGPIHSLAVLPLTELAPDSATAYLREGIPEAVADLLRRLPQLSVTAPSLASQLLAREPDADLRDVGRRLGVKTFLAGRMRRWGDSLHLRAELVRVDDGRLLWGESYEIAFASLMELERKIVRTIADTLRVQLSGEQTTRLQNRPTTDPVAYDEFLRARYLWSSATPLGGNSARIKADSILYYASDVQRRAPDFAGGYFLQGAYYSLAGIRGWRQPFGVIVDSARAAARRAIELDPQMAEPWLVLGVLSFYATDDWAESRRLVRRAVELNPTYTEARYFYGLYLAEVDGQLDSGIAHLRATLQVDSLINTLNSLGDLYLRARKYDSAQLVLGRAVAKAPEVQGPRIRLIRALEATGQLDSAVAVRRTARDTTRVGEFAAALARDSAAGYRRVLEADLRARIDSIEQSMKAPKSEIADTIPPLRERRIAALYAQLGDWTRAADWVLREHARRPGRFRTVLTDPDFAPVRNDPRIVALARREKLAALLGR